MGALVVSLAGTPAGEALALALALLSALSHAIFGAINKGGRDPYLNRGAINVAYGLMAAPFALFVFPAPTPALWAVLLGAWAIHIVYEWLQARSYEIGGFTVVYPIARGTGPLATVLVAGAVFGEHFGPGQWAGLLLLTGGIWGLGLANIRATGFDDPTAARRLRAAILTALATGVLIAVYTTVDAWGVRLAADPFTFLAWFFTLGGVGFPMVAAARWARLAPADRPDPGELAVRGLFGALIAFLSFGSVMLATRVGHVGEVAAIRETSIVFATAIGVLFFRETIDARRLALIAAIAAGAVVIKIG
jgi:drug/metabolite transporter (DMT)-like permease